MHHLCILIVYNLSYGTVCLFCCFFIFFLLVSYKNVLYQINQWTDVASYVQTDLGSNPWPLSIHVPKMGFNPALQYTCTTYYSMQTTQFAKEPGADSLYVQDILRACIASLMLQRSWECHRINMSETKKRGMWGQKTAIHKQCISTLCLCRDFDMLFQKHYVWTLDLTLSAYPS